MQIQIWKYKMKFFPTCILREHVPHVPLMVQMDSWLTIMTLALMTFIRILIRCGTSRHGSKDECWEFNSGQRLKNTLFRWSLTLFVSRLWGNERLNVTDRYRAWKWQKWDRREKHADIWRKWLQLTSSLHKINGFLLILVSATLTEQFY